MVFGDSLKSDEFISQELDKIESLRQVVIDNPEDFDDDLIILANNSEKFRDRILKYNYFDTGLVNQNELDEHFDYYSCTLNTKYSKHPLP